MSLQQEIQEYFRKKEISKKEKETLRIVVGELQRQKTKDVSDPEVVKIIKKLAASEREMGQRKDQEYIDILESFLPEEAGEEEITEWIRQNIDFSRYKNKMQAMKDILVHFGPAADGNQVKDILMKKF
ncbi:MAG: GatB/YqeY domain-containing protein [Desulfohalobiaceae bacterium]|nr:GatB/YqeY domain-containing protein [Desulfohalobiaceae bacterium]